MNQAVASLGSWKSTSVAYQWPTPWTRKGVLDWFRHWLKYSTGNAGHSSVYASHVATLATYNLVNDQQAPTLSGYEGAVESIAPSSVQTGPDGSGYYLRAQLQHDLYYDPDMYYCEMALLQQAQQGGMSEFMEFYLCNVFGGTSGSAKLHWPLAAWAGQPAGYGDGTGTTTIGCIGTIDGVNPVGTLVTKSSGWTTASASPRQRRRPTAGSAGLDGQLQSDHRDAAQLAAVSAAGRRSRRPAPPRSGRPGLTAASAASRCRTSRRSTGERRNSGPGNGTGGSSGGGPGLSTQGRVNAAAGIISITPGPLAVKVAANVVVTVVFAQSMNASTITTTNFTLTSLASGAIAGLLPIRRARSPRRSRRRPCSARTPTQSHSRTRSSPRPRGDLHDELLIPGRSGHQLRTGPPVVPRPLEASMSRDRDVRNAIQSTLVATGAFDAVWIWGLPENQGEPASQAPRRRSSRRPARRTTGGTRSRAAV